MIVLTATQKLQVLLAGAVSSVQPYYSVSYRTRTGSPTGNPIDTPGHSIGQTSDATAVDVVAAAGTGALNLVDNLTIYNADDAAVVVTVQVEMNSAGYPVKKFTLEPGASMTYEAGRGWGDALTITAGNTAITGTLSVSGAATLSDTLAVTGNETVGGTLEVTGATTLTGAAALSSTLSVAGALSTSALGGLTAHAGGGQGSALALTKDNNRIATCATAGDSVKLPAATAGKRVFVKNAGAESCDVFPSTGEVINALAANAAYALATTKGAMFICVTAGTWETILTA